MRRLIFGACLLWALPAVATEADEACKAEFIACQQRTGNPLECQAELRACSDAPAPAAADPSQARNLAFSVSLGSEQGPTGDMLRHALLTARNRGGRPVDLALATPEYVATARCADGTLEEIRFQLGITLEANQERLVGKQLRCIEHGGTVAVIDGGAGSGGDAVGADVCPGLVVYRDTVLVDLLDRNWPRRSMALGVSQGTIDQLQADLRKVAQTRGELEDTATWYRIFTGLEAMVGALQRVPGLDKGICFAKALDDLTDPRASVTAGACFEEVMGCLDALVKPGENLLEQGLNATGCVVALGGKNVSKALKTLYEVANGSYTISKDLVDLRNEQRVMEGRVAMARALLVARSDALLAAIDDYQQAFAEAEALRAVNRTREAIDAHCAAKPGAGIDLSMAAAPTRR